MNQVLVVEDDPDIASVLVDYLRSAGFDAAHTEDGGEALARILAAPPDLVLLDVMLPGLDGLSVLAQVRQRMAALPVILITARVEEIDRLLGLETGADDYVCKPFSPREVVARVRAVLRRAQGHAGQAEAATERPAPPTEARLQLDATSGRATLDGHALGLTRKEFQLLQHLAASPGRIFPRARLLDLAYADDLDANERAIDSHVKNLRRKLASASPAHEWIRSVYGVGFVLEPPAPG